MTFDEIEAAYREAFRALKLFEAANQKKPAMEPARLLMLNDLAQRARALAADAIKYLPAQEMSEMIERFDADRRIEVAKAGLIGAKPATSLRQ